MTSDKEPSDDDRRVDEARWVLSGERSARLDAWRGVTPTNGHTISGGSPVRGKTEQLTFLEIALPVKGEDLVSWEIKRPQ